MNRPPVILYMTAALLFGLFWGCDGPQQTKDADQKEERQVAASVDPESNEGDGTIQESGDGGEAVDPKEHMEAETKQPARSLFDGKTLDGWETIEFGGEGDVEIVDGTIHMYSGDPLTGISVTGQTELPESNYEISLEAMKLEGSDFFAAITFPVNDSFCTMVVGGWGGTLVGLSNLDDQDASGNDTRLMKKFEKDQWYAIRIQVLPDRIVGWIDDEKLIDKSIEGVKVSIRSDVAVTTPLGITNFTTSSAIRSIELRELK